MITKSLVRHILTGIGVLLTALGVGKFAGIIDFTLVNLDGTWQAVTTIIGVITTIYGYFKGKTTT